jgi:diadenosine tetraphosphate (Ap4A) HIT family hydrolase
MPACATCALLAARDTGTRPLWDNIFRTAHWDVVHAFDTSLPGWLVLVARRHIEAVADLTREEATQLGLLIHATSQALAEATGCVKTYVVQFAESADHPHVHVHVIARQAGHPDELRGPRVFGALGVPENQRVPEAEMNRIATKVGAALSAAAL